MRFKNWHIHFIVPSIVFLFCLLIHNNMKKGYIRYSKNSFKQKYFNQYSHIFKCLLPNSSNVNSQKNNVSCPITSRPIQILKSPEWANDTHNDNFVNDTFVSFFILSSPKNFEERKVMRNELQLFLKTKNFNPSKSLKLATQTFVIGNSGNKSIERRLKQEIDMYGDILWLIVKDTYRNLPLKSIGYFSWISNITKYDQEYSNEYGRKETIDRSETDKHQEVITKNHESRDSIRWIVKIDDDVNVNYQKLFDTLEKKNTYQYHGDNTDQLSILCSTVQNNNIAVRRSDCMTRKW